MTVLCVAVLSAGRARALLAVPNVCGELDTGRRMNLGKMRERLTEKKYLGDLCRTQSSWVRG